MCTASWRDGSIIDGRYGWSYVPAICNELDHQYRLSLVNMAVRRCSDYTWCTILNRHLEWLTFIATFHLHNQSIKSQGSPSVGVVTGDETNLYIIDKDNGNAGPTHNINSKPVMVVGSIRMGLS